MPMDEIEAIIDDIVRLIRRALVISHNDGRDKGAAEMRAAILSALKAPSPQTESRQTFLGAAGATGTGGASRSTGSIQRAPKGLIYLVLEDALTGHPGATVRELEHLVTEAEPRISAKSVGNTLRRLEGKNYVRDGECWFLKRASPQKESAEVATNDPSADAFT